MIRANLLIADNYTGANLVKLRRICGLIEQALNSPAFSDAVTNFDKFSFMAYKCYVLFRTGRQLPYMTNADVLATILRGHSANVDGSTNMDLKLVLSNDNGGDVVGSTDENTGITTTYYDYFTQKYTAPQLAAHYVHEYCHTLGFDHSFSRTCDNLRDCYSVPYAIQHLVEITLTGANADGCVYKNVAGPAPVAP